MNKATQGKTPKITERIDSQIQGPSQPVWPEKNRQMSIKVAKNDFTRKMIDFDTITKIA